MIVATGCRVRDFYEQELLWPDGAPGALGQRDGDTPELFYYLPAAGTSQGVAAIVAPGGSYAHTGGLWAEAFPTARWLVEQGITAVVLRYRVSGDGYHHHAFLADGQQAVRRVRARAGELGVDPDKIGMIGFSAGGHLAGFVANTCSQPGAATDAVSCRPDFITMVYPVVTMDDRWAHLRSKDGLLGDEILSPELWRHVSIERGVTANSPPALLVHSRLDRKVHVHNSEMYHQAMLAQGRTSHSLIYDDGSHGVGLGRNFGMPQMQCWPRELLKWLRQIGMVTTDVVAGPSAARLAHCK